MHYYFQYSIFQVAKKIMMSSCGDGNSGVANLLVTGEVLNKFNSRHGVVTREVSNGDMSHDASRASPCEYSHIFLPSFVLRGFFITAFRIARNYFSN